MSLVFQWTTFLCPASKLWSQRQEPFFVAWKKEKTEEERQKKTAVYGLHFWVCVRLSLLKVKPERCSTPVLHRLLSFNSLCSDWGHRRWLHMQSSRLTAYKQHLALISEMNVCVVNMCKHPWWWCCRTALNLLSLLPHHSLFLFFFFCARFQPSTYAEDRSQDAIIYTYMI